MAEYQHFNNINKYDRTKLKKKIIGSLDKKLIFISALAGCGKSSLMDEILAETNILNFRFYIHDSPGETDIFTSMLARFLRTDVLTQNLMELTDEEYRNLFSGINSEVYIIAENFQNTAGNPVLKTLIERLINLSGDNFHFFIISDRHIDLNNIKEKYFRDSKRFDSKDFLLNNEECIKFVMSLQHDFSRATASLVYTLTDGWMMGILAISEALNINSELLPLFRHEDILFIRHLPQLNEFIAEKIYHPLNDEVKEFLLDNAIDDTIYLEFGGNGKIPAAVNFIKELENSGICTACVSSKDYGYKINKSIQAFLYNKMLLDLTTTEMESKHLLTGQFHETRRNWGKAFYHYVYGNQLLKAAAALKYLAFQEVDDFLLEKFKLLIMANDTNDLDSNPWVQFGYALSMKYKQPYMALYYFDKALNGFYTANNSEGQMIVICHKASIVFFSIKRMDLLRELIHEFETDHELNHTQNLTIKGYRMVFAAYTYLTLQCNYDVTAKLIEESKRIGIIKRDNNLIMWNYFVTLAMCYHTGDIKAAKVVINEVEEIFDAPDVQKSLRMYLSQRIAFLFTFMGEYEKSLFWFEKCKNLALEIEAGSYNVFINHLIAYLFDFLGQNMRAEALVADIERISKSVLNEQNEHLWAYYLNAKAHHFLMIGDFDLAVETARSALTFRRKAGGETQLIRTLIIYGAALTESKDFNQASIVLNEAISISKKISASFFEASVYFHKAILEKKHNKKFKRSLNEAFKIAENKEYFHFFASKSDQIIEMIDELEENSNYPGYLKQLRNKNILSNENKNLVINEMIAGIDFYLMGPFRTKLYDIQENNIKSAKALYLLKMLLVSEEAVNINTITEELWPDLDFKQIMNNFYYILYELRKYLNNKDSVVYKGGLCSLRTGLYTTDIHVFRYLIKEARRYSAIGNYKEAENFFDNAFELYRGSFFEGDSLGSYLYTESVVLERQIYDLLIEYTTILLKNNNYKKVITVLDKTTGNSFLDEDAYRLRMIAHYKSGKRKSALEVYEQLKDWLKQEMNVEPLQQTKELYELIKAGRNLNTD